MVDFRVAVILAVVAVLIAGALYEDGHNDMYQRVQRKKSEAQDVATSAYKRTTQWITYDNAKGLKLEAWLYTPTNPSQTPPPVVVMANGLGLNKDAGLENFARVFAEQGIATLAFDHRNFGGSDGEPRHHIKISEHVSDWEKVLVFLANNATGINNKKIALWGYSIGSGAALSAASTSLVNLKKQNVTISGVILNTPIVDAFALVFDYHWRHISTKYFTGILLGLKDILYSFFGYHRYVKLAASPEDTLMSAIHDEDWKDYINLVPSTPHGGWENKVTAQSLFQLILYRPSLYANSVEAPTLVVLAKKDNYGNPRSIRELATTIPNAKLEEYDITCFELLKQNNIAEQQAEFLKGVF
jgi:pimeloyl-ACP methyl ester carboxylesterase